MNVYNKLYRLKEYLSQNMAYVKNIFFYIITFSYLIKIDNTFKNIKNILIIKQGVLGDTIINYDLVQSVKKKFINANIYLVGNKKYSIFFKNLNIIYIDDINKIKNTKMDIVIDLSPKRENYNMYRKQKPKIILFRPCFVASDNLFFGATKYIKPKYNPHITDYNKSIIKELNAKYITIHEKYSEQNYIVFHIGAAKKIRYMPIDICLDIIKYLQNQNYKIYLTYNSKYEKEYINTIINKLTNKENIYMFNKPLPKINELIKNAKIIISSDTGIAHIAGLYNKKLITIFGPGSINTWRPLGENTKIVYNTNECHGCQRHKDNWKCTHECLENIKSKEIIDIIKKFEKT